MTDFPNKQNNPAGATPVWLAPSPNGGFLNITTDTLTQAKTGAGSLTGLSVNTAGTASTAELFDGNSSVVTITIATPAVISWTAHGKAAGAAVKFETTGALPTGLTAGTTYYVSSATLTADTFVVADTHAHAIAGTNSITTSGTQSGIQTAFDVSNVIGTVATTAQGTIPYAVPLALGLIVLTASSGAANLTVTWA